MNKLISTLLFSAVCFVPGAAMADAGAGQAKAKQACAACHGENGDKPLQPEYPILAGQHRDYLVKVLGDYKSGARKNAIMGGQAQQLSPGEIRDLAEWFSTRPGPLSVKH